MNEPVRCPSNYCRLPKIKHTSGFHVVEHDVNLLYLDDYHAGDVLFVQSLARSLARMTGRRIVLVHGAGEHAERALEAEGIFRKREGGVLPVESAAEHALVERALRHVNRKITSVLTDAVVPAIAVMGSERGLFRIHEDKLTAENIGWLEALVLQGVIPVLAAYAVESESGRTGEVPIYNAIHALAQAFSRSTRTVAFTKTNLPGIMKGGSPEEEGTIDEIDAGIVADIEGVRYLVSESQSVLLTNTTRLSDSDGPTGTRIKKST